MNTHIFKEGDMVVVFINKKAVVGKITKLLNKVAHIHTMRDTTLIIDNRKLRIYKEAEDEDTFTS